MFLKYLSTPTLTQRPNGQTESFEFSIIYHEFIEAVKSLSPNHNPMDEEIKICKSQYLNASHSEKHDINMAFSHLTNCLKSIYIFPHLLEVKVKQSQAIIFNLLSSPFQIVIEHGLFLLKGVQFIFQDQEVFKFKSFPFKTQWNVYCSLWPKLPSSIKMKALTTLLKKDHFSFFLFDLINEKKENIDFLNRQFQVLHDLNTLLWQSDACLNTKVMSSCSIDIATFFIACLTWHIIDEHLKSTFVLFFLNPVNSFRLQTFHQNIHDFLEKEYPSLLKENSQKIQAQFGLTLCSELSNDPEFKKNFLNVLQSSCFLEDSIFWSSYLPMDKEKIKILLDSMSLR